MFVFVGCEAVVYVELFYLYEFWDHSLNLALFNHPTPDLTEIHALKLGHARKHFLFLILLIHFLKDHFDYVAIV
jgi:hypothetical protein